MDDKIDVEKLIREVENQPALWNMTIPEYSDRAIRKKCWEEITDAFSGADMPIEQKRKLGDLLHKKWKNIRDRFARDMQENKKMSGAKAHRKSYMYTPKLLFLKDTIIPKLTIRSLPADDEDLMGQLAVETQRDTRSSRIGQKRMHSIEDKILKKARAKEKAKNEDEVDDNQQFLLSLLPALKLLPRPLNTNCRIELLQCISRYESLALSQSGQQYSIPTNLHQSQQCVHSEHMSQSPLASIYSKPESIASTSIKEETVSPMVSPTSTVSPIESLATCISSYNTDDESDDNEFS